MTPERVREVITLYRERLNQLSCQPVQHPHSKHLHDTLEGFDHCLAMLDTMEVFLDKGRMGKVFRLLGFTQGYMWSNSMYTLDDLKLHNKPD